MIIKIAVSLALWVFHLAEKIIIKITIIKIMIIK